MKQRHLGRTGLRVSELCLGAMVFSDDEQGHAILNTFADEGGTFIDTADMYGNGTSEEILGRWLKGRDRDRFVIATKVFATTGEGPNDGGLSRKHVVSAVEASLRRLGTDYVDLYQTHVWDATTPIEETLGTLDTLVQAGKVRYVGASNIAPGQLQRALDVARGRGWEPYVSLQPLYNLLYREVEWELGPICEAEGIGIIPWSPLQGGWLTGKYRRGMSAAPAGSREERYQRELGREAWRERDNEETWRVVDALLEVAEETERAPSQVALRWLLGRPAVTAPIVGARTVEQLEENLGAVGWSLSPEQVARLDAASERPRPYPYDILHRFRNRAPQD